MEQYNINANITLSVSGRAVPVKSFMFSAGEIQVRIDRSLITLLEVFATAPIDITAHLRSSDDIMALKLLLDAIAEMRGAAKFCNTVHLTIPYFPYARQDRACVEGESYASRVIAQLFNNGYGRTLIQSLTTWDIHSDRAIPFNSVDYIVRNVPAKQLAYDLMVDNPDYVIVRPDEGAETRAKEVASITGAPIVRMEKTRDPDTGKLTGFRFATEADIDNAVTGRPLLIVDDICDGGRTFNGIAERIKEHSPKAVIDLYVTHGIFSAGFSLFTNIRRIFTANNVNDIDLPEDGYVTVL